MTSVCIVGVYFGSLPNYFDLWLRSAEANTTVDFLIFTNQIKADLPDNVKFVSMTLEEMKLRAEKVLGFSVSLERPYKCCDFKPLYGLIFADYLSKYDYWGHCDFDLIWGDLRSFFEIYHLEKYDKFLPLGHLSLYKNTEENNRRYKLSGSKVGTYNQVFLDPHNFAFDEMGGIFQVYKEHDYPMFSNRIFADISKIYKRYRLALDDKNYDQQVFYWNNGKVKRAYLTDKGIQNEEFIYIHFKERGALPFDKASLTAPMFYVTNSGFYGKKTVCLEDFERYNFFPGTGYEKRENFKFCIMERKNNFLKRIKRMIGKEDRIR